MGGGGGGGGGGAVTFNTFNIRILTYSELLYLFSLLTFTYKEQLKNNYEENNKSTEKISGNKT